MSAVEREAAFKERSYPNQEEEVVLRERLLNGLQEILTEYPNKKVILVAHGAVIYMMLRMISNENIGLKRIRLANACFSTIKHDINSWIITNFNQISHLS